MRKQFVLLSFLMLLPFSLQSQPVDSGTLSGFVYDEANGESIIGANVYLEGTILGSSTNLGGYYVIPQVAAGEYVLIAEYLGYKTFKQQIIVESGENKKINIKISEEIMETETIQVVADSIPTIEKLFLKPISEVNLTSKQISQIPQIAEADLLRSLQTLPGIEPISDISSAIYVRGGTPDQNLYLIDGTDVYNPEHAFGLFSTFNTEAIKQVDLSKGGFGAEFGGRLSSVINITNLDGNREKFEGSASISLLSAKTTLQMPIGNIGSLSGSIRRTYFDKTIAKLIEDVPDYYFYDGNLKAFIDIDKNNKLTISYYGGSDVLNYVFNKNAGDNIGLDYDWGNQTGSIRWTKVFSPILFSNFWITASHFSSYFNFDEFNVKEKNNITDITLKGNLEYHPSNLFSTKFGFEQKNFKTLYKNTFPGGEVNVPASPKQYTLYVQGNWKPDFRWDVELGLRYNYFNSDKDYQNIEPRVCAKYKLTDKINLKAATGIYNQYLHRVPRFMIADIWTVSNKYQSESKCTHLILGYQQEISEDYQFEVESFYKKYDNIYSFNQTFQTELSPDIYNANDEPVYNKTGGLFNSGDGNSMGFEVMLRKDVGIMTGWVGYTLSKTTYNIRRINQGRDFYPRHDKTSTLKFTGNIKLSGNPQDVYQGTWHLGFNFIYSSGQPYTEPGSAYIIASDPEAPERYVRYAPTKINNIRLPYYSRLDLSITYSKRFKYWAIEPYLQIFNIGNRKNVWFLNYEYHNGLPEINEEYMLPLLPTLGVNIKF